MSEGAAEARDRSRAPDALFITEWIGPRLEDDGEGALLAGDREMIVDHLALRDLGDQLHRDIDRLSGQRGREVDRRHEGDDA